MLLKNKSVHIKDLENDSSVNGQKVDKKIEHLYNIYDNNTYKNRLKVFQLPHHYKYERGEMKNLKYSEKKISSKQIIISISICCTEEQ